MMDSLDFREVVFAVAEKCGYDPEDIFTVITDEDVPMKRFCVVFRDGTGTIVEIAAPITDGDTSIAQ